MQVVVVESPAKAKTVGRYLGDGYRVLATLGHVSDLPAKEGSVRPAEGFAMSGPLHAREGGEKSFWKGTHDEWEDAMTERYTVMTFVGPGSILWTDRFETEPEFDDKPAAWEEAKARVAEHPEEITIVYLAQGDERTAVWSNRPDIVFQDAA